jgi:hypothetical protein
MEFVYPELPRAAELYSQDWGPYFDAKSKLVSKSVCEVISCLESVVPARHRDWSVEARPGNEPLRLSGHFAALPLLSTFLFAGSFRQLKSRTTRVT